MKQQPDQLPAPCISFTKLGLFNPTKIRLFPVPGLIRGVGFKRTWLLDPQWPCASLRVNRRILGTNLPYLMYGNKSNYALTPYKVG